MNKTPKKKRRTPESMNDPRKGYAFIDEFDHEELGGQCRVCGTSIRYDQILEHEITGLRVTVGRSCAKKLLEPYSDAECRSPKKIESIRKRIVDDSWDFVDFGKDLLKYELRIPKAKIVSIMNHKGLFEVKLFSKNNREIHRASEKDPTDLNSMRREIYLAYRKLVSKTR